MDYTTEQSGNMDSAMALEAGNQALPASMIAGAPETRIVRMITWLDAEMKKVTVLPAKHRHASWDVVVTNDTLIFTYMPPILRRGAKLAVFEGDYQTALPFLRAAAAVCSGWGVPAAWLLIAGCCNALGDAEGTDASCEAFELDCLALETRELRDLPWRLPGLDRRGYEPRHGPSWLPDEAAAQRYVARTRTLYGDQAGNATSP